MSLLGIDAGTTGCKAISFSEKGDIIASSYVEYDAVSSGHGRAELNSALVWQKILKLIRKTAWNSGNDPVTGISVSSLGEAVVPVSRNRDILGPSILNFDSRGSEYLGKLPCFQDARKLYSINGNTLANSYGLTKLLWIRDHQSSLYEKTYKFLNWGAFITFMLGSDPIIDYSLANRSLLFDLNSRNWSETLLSEAGLDREKLPEPVQAGTVCGTVSGETAAETGLPAGIPIVTGAHDQFANALGCGIIDEGQAMYGMGTFICIVPVFEKRKNPDAMISMGLNTEHHAVPGKFGTFIYGPGGVLVKWYRDTFAAAEHEAAQQQGEDVYLKLFKELPEGPSRIASLPHFTALGPPEFIDNSCGLLSGLYLNTSRGEVLKGLIEGATFSLKETVDRLPDAGIPVTSYVPAGGGSKSDVWIQLSADIMGKPFSRPRVSEAGSLGAAILAGIGTGAFSDAREGIDAMVELERPFEPDLPMHRRYEERFEKFKNLWPLMKDYLTHLNS